jgi:hypothetical protein
LLINLTLSRLQALNNSMAAIMSTDCAKQTGLTQHVLVLNLGDGRKGSEAKIPK